MSLETHAIEMIEIIQRLMKITIYYLFFTNEPKVVFTLEKFKNGIFIECPLNFHYLNG